MTTSRLHHIIRIRTTEDLGFVRPALMDEVIVNANLLELRPESTATALERTSLPYSIDPLLTRFQMPEWWLNDKGETKRNYERLGAAYVKGTSVQFASGPLLDAVSTDDEWRVIAANVISYQQDRLVEIHPQTELFRDPLRPVRLMAPALVAFSSSEDRVNHLLFEAATDAAGQGVGVPVIVPPERLVDPTALNRLVRSLPTDGVTAYFLWTPETSEARLLVNREMLHAVLRLVSILASRGIPVGHLHGGYLISALHDIGISAVVQHLGWVDRGEPARQSGGGPRSCQTYVPGVRRTVRFELAETLGRDLDGAAFTNLYCWCNFCSGAFDVGEHPLDFPLESQTITDKRGHVRETPTSRAAGLNTWHYLHGRRQEVDAFSSAAAREVVEQDIERASALAGHSAGDRLRRIVSGIG